MLKFDLFHGRQLIVVLNLLNKTWSARSLEIVSPSNLWRGKIFIIIYFCTWINLKLYKCRQFEFKHITCLMSAVALSRNIESK